MRDNLVKLKKKIKERCWYVLRQIKDNQLLTPSNFLRSLFLIFLSWEFYERITVLISTSLSTGSWLWQCGWWEQSWKSFVFNQKPFACRLEQHRQPTLCILPLLHVFQHSGAKPLTKVSLILVINPLHGFLSSVFIFSILCSVHFLCYWQGEFVWQSKLFRLAMISFILMVLIKSQHYYCKEKLTDGQSLSVKGYW